MGLKKRVEMGNKRANTNRIAEVKPFPGRRYPFFAGVQFHASWHLINGNGGVSMAVVDMVLVVVVVG